MSNDLVKYTDERGQELSVTEQQVRQLLVHGNGALTNQEVARFLWLCQYQRLNPFLGDAYLIKYGNDASMVVSKDVHVRRAAADPQYDGMESGVVVDEGKGLEYRPGALILAGEQILGGWARVYRKDRTHPVYVAVAFDEYAARKSGGDLNRQWATKGATMIVKVAESQALRKSFPERLEKLYAAEEMEQISGGSGETKEPREEVDVIDLRPDATVVEAVDAEVIDLPTKPRPAKQPPVKEATKGAQAETSKASDLYREYRERLAATSALNDAEREKALAALVRHKDDADYLTKAIARLEEKERDAEIPFGNANIYSDPDQASDEAPASEET